METKQTKFRNSVSQTLFIPLWAKARETNLPNGILRDAEAARIVSSLPKELFSFPKKKPMMFGSVVRTRYFDDIAAKELERDGDTVLVHLGCGLDDRFGRTDRGRGWQVNIDLPDVMALRNELMPSASERNVDWDGSILETGWMDRLLDSWPKGRFTFFMEGLLMYFKEAEVRGFFVNLADRFPGAGLCFDTCSGYMCKMLNKQEAMRQANATMHWGMDDERVLERWDARLRHVETAYYFDMFRKRWGWLSLLRFLPRVGRGSKMLFYRIEW